MKRKNQTKSTSKPPNKQVIDVEDDNEQPDFPSYPGSSLESDKLDDKKKATPAEAKGKRGRPKGSKNTKAEKESKAKGSTKSKKNVKEESEEEEENEELPGTQEIEVVYEHTKTTEVIEVDDENDPQAQISQIVHELSTKTLNIKNPLPLAMEEEEEKEESKVPENPEEEHDDISIEASEVPFCPYFSPQNT